MNLRPWRWLRDPMAANDNPLPTKPQPYLKGGTIAFAAPVDPVEACLAAPAVRALRHARPHAALAVVFPESQRPIWESSTRLEALLGYPDGASARQIAALLASGPKPWESIILWEPGEVAKAAKKAGINQRVGYPLPGLARRLNEPIEPPKHHGPVEHRVRHYLSLLERLGMQAMVPESFATCGVPGPQAGSELLVAPASSFGPSHEWPVERFAAVLTRVRNAMPDINILVLSEPERPAPARQLAADAGLELVHCQSLAQTTEVLRRASLLFSCDSAIVHLAAHLGLPTAVIFGPNEPAWRRPLGRQHTILQHKVECAPCLLAKCPLDLRCQLELTVDDVSTRVLEALASCAGQSVHRDAGAE